MSKYIDLCTKILCNAMINACTDYLDITDKHKKDFGLLKLTVGELNSIGWPIGTFGVGGEALSIGRAFSGLSGDSGINITTKRGGMFHGTAGGRRAYKYCEFFRRLNQIDTDLLQNAGVLSDGITEEAISSARYKITQLTILNFLKKRTGGFLGKQKIYRSSLASFAFINILTHLYNYFELFKHEEVKTFIIKNENKDNIKKICERFSSIGVKNFDGITSVAGRAITAGFWSADEKDKARKKEISDFIAEKRPI